jgi:hypothetical protein
MTQIRMTPIATKQDAVVVMLFMIHQNLNHASQDVPVIDIGTVDIADHVKLIVHVASILQKQVVNVNQVVHVAVTLMEG